MYLSRLRPNRVSECPFFSGPIGEEHIFFGSYGSNRGMVSLSSLLVFNPVLSVFLFLSRVQLGGVVPF